MKFFSILPLCLAALLFGIAVSDAASSSVAIADVNLRAGPATSEPAIATVRGGEAVTVFTCLKTRSWCDVSWRGMRGWISSRYLAADQAYSDDDPGFESPRDPSRWQARRDRFERRRQAFDGQPRPHRDRDVRGRREWTDHGEDWFADDWGPEIYLGDDRDWYGPRRGPDARRGYHGDKRWDRADRDGSTGRFDRRRHGERFDDHTDRRRRAPRDDDIHYRNGW